MTINEKIEKIKTLAYKLGFTDYKGFNHTHLLCVKYKNYILWIYENWSKTYIQICQLENDVKVYNHLYKNDNKLNNINYVDFEKSFFEYLNNDLRKIKIKLLLDL